MREISVGELVVYLDGSHVVCGVVSQVFDCDGEQRVRFSESSIEPDLYEAARIDVFAMDERPRFVDRVNEIGCDFYEFVRQVNLVMATVYKRCPVAPHAST